MAAQLFQALVEADHATEVGALQDEAIADAGG